jgi:hypothetical protein
MGKSAAVILNPGSVLISNAPFGKNRISTERKFDPVSD